MMNNTLPYVFIAPGLVEGLLHILSDDSSGHVEPKRNEGGDRSAEIEHMPGVVEELREGIFPGSSLNDTGLSMLSYTLASFVFEGDDDVDNIVKDGDCKEDLCDLGDESEAVKVGKEPDRLHAEPGPDSATDKLCHASYDAEHVDLGVVGGELDQNSPGPVVDPVVGLEHIHFLLESVDEARKSEDVATAAVTVDAGAYDHAFQVG